MHRFAFLSLIALSFLFMMLGKAEVSLIERVRTMTADLLAPVFDIMSRPVETLGDVAADGHAMMDLWSENKRLQEEVLRLQQWQEVARRLDAENRSLRSMLNFNDPTALHATTGRVIADSGGSFVRNVLVSVGAGQGVTKGQPAVTGEGLVGRVTEVGERTSRILLLTDLNSRIPVMIDTTRERAMLAGDNTTLPRLLYLGQDSRVQIGDRVVTSGHGGAFPPGLPVGMVVAVGERGVQVRPYADWQRLEHVRLLEYAPEAPAPQTGPSAR